jgi:hypothetical protein
MTVALQVDAIVSTIGFPLVGGPAGTMEGGRQADIAKTILAAKNVPYFVAAPLLIQDLTSWSRDGVAGLQSVVRFQCLVAKQTGSLVSKQTGVSHACALVTCLRPDLFVQTALLTLPGSLRLQDAWGR